MLKLDPVRDFGERWWAVLLKDGGVFAAGSAACRETFSEIRWINQTAAAASEYFSCEQCASPVIRCLNPDDKEQDDMVVSCSARGSESGMKPLMERATLKQHRRAMYESQSRGGKPPVVRCPRCYMYSFVAETNECAACDNSLNPSAVWCDNVQRFSPGGAAHGPLRGAPAVGIRAGERKTSWTKPLSPPPGLWVLTVPGPFAVPPSVRVGRWLDAIRRSNPAFERPAKLGPERLAPARAWQRPTQDKSPRPVLACELTSWGWAIAPGS
jgi:hypothetical protein